MAKPVPPPPAKPKPKPKPRRRSAGKPAHTPAPPPPPRDSEKDSSQGLDDLLSQASKKPTGGSGSASAPSNLPEKLDSGAVRRGVNKEMGRIRSCANDHKEKGAVKITFTITPAGRVSSTKVVSSPSTGLGDCVAKALRKARFDASQKGMSVTYPFLFR